MTKRGLTSLSHVDALDEGQRAKLEKAGVGSVEELVGLVESEPQGLGDLLELSDAQLDRLKTDAWAALPDEIREAFERMPDMIIEYGAVEPDQD